MILTHEILYGEGWRSPDTYDPEFAALPKAPAVYLVAAVQLWPIFRGPLRFEVAYVGMSENVANRLTRRHAALTKIEKEGLWPQRFFKPCDQSQLRTLERQLIRQYQPRLNITGKVDALQ